MFIKIDYRLRLCVCLLILIHLIDEIECHTNGLLDKLKQPNYDRTNSNSNEATLRKRNANANANSPKSTNNKNNLNLEHFDKSNLSPEVRQSIISSLNKYFVLHNLLNTRQSKRSAVANSFSSAPFSIYPSSSSSSSFIRKAGNSFKPSTNKRQLLTTNNLPSSTISDQTAKLNRLNASSTFLNLVSNWKKQQPSCTELRALWDTSLGKLMDYFLNENNDLFIQPHLNTMDNPIYLALLINLINDQQLSAAKDEQMKPVNELQLKNGNNQRGHHSKANDVIFNNKQTHQSKQDTSGSPLTVDYVMNNLLKNKNYDKHNPMYLDDKLEQPYVFQNFKLADKNSEPKSIRSPMEGRYHSQEIVEDGPMIIYEAESDNGPSSFWSDAQLSKPVKKPGIY